MKIRMVIFGFMRKLFNIYRVVSMWEVCVINIVLRQQDQYVAENKSHESRPLLESNQNRWITINWFNNFWRYSKKRSFLISFSARTVLRVVPENLHDHNEALLLPQNQTDRAKGAQLQPSWWLKRIQITNALCPFGLPLGDPGPLGDLFVDLGHL